MSFLQRLIGKGTSELTALVLQDKPEQVSAGLLESRADLVTVIGCGNSARALSSFLSSKGYAVNLLVRNLEKVPGIRESLKVRAHGKIEGTFDLNRVTDDIGKAVSGARTIFIATVTTAYEEIATKLAPALLPGQEVILFSSKFGGAVLFASTLARLGVTGVTVMETDALFACRTQEDGSIWIRGFKNWTLFSGVTRSSTLANAGVIQRFFPDLEAADNIVQRGLTDFGALAHPLTMLVNMNSVDRGEPFLFYVNGFTERTVALLEKMEKEFRTVAHAYGTSLIPMPELLNRYYGCDTSSLLAAMGSVPNYKVSQSPVVLKHRYIEEDVACSLVPIRNLAKLAGVDVPTVDAVVTMATTLLGTDFAARGRTMEKFGWDGMSFSEIKKAINE